MYGKQREKYHLCSWKSKDLSLSESLENQVPGACHKP